MAEENFQGAFSRVEHDANPMATIVIELYVEVGYVTIFFSPVVMAFPKGNCAVRNLSLPGLW